MKYTFKTLGGAYKTKYKFAAGPNPEDSLVTAPYHQHHFSDRWASDRLNVTAPGSSGVDILDRHKAMFGPGVCGRSEDTFNAGEGAFITNTGGPVRAIRSYVGANSGPNTQREHVFYDRREDIRTNLRVHTIPIGSSAIWFNGTIPCTDPGTGCTDTLSATRTLYFGAPGATAAQASALSNGVAQPLSATGTSWP